MKRVLLISVILVSMLLSACATPVTKPELTPTPTPTPAPTPTPTPTPAQINGNLNAYFIDVGQGDSILLDQRETEVLIDGGEASPGVTDFLKKYVDGPLEVVVATHPHADHIGGLASVLGTFKVLDVWTNGETSTSATYGTFTAAVQTSGASVHTGRRGDKITTGELSFSVLNPVTLTGTTNNNSIVLSLDYGETSFLFEGDAEKQAEAAVLGAGVVPHAQILKVGHHGSRTASSQPFLAAVQPKVAVYMAGVGNQYGHPHQETLNALSQIGAKVYGTDINCTIEISTDGKTFTVQTSKPTSTSTPTLNPSPNPTTTVPSNGTDIVYITSSGTKYHRAGCRYLSKSCIPIERAEAIKKGYTPCSVCKP